MEEKIKKQIKYNTESITELVNELKSKRQLKAKDIVSTASLIEFHRKENITLKSLLL